MTNSFYPEDTDTTFFVLENTDMQSILDKAKEKWGDDIQLCDIQVNPTYIHTRCIGYDMYDSSDYDNFLEVYILK